MKTEYLHERVHRKRDHGFRVLEKLYLIFVRHGAMIPHLSAIASGFHLFDVLLIINEAIFAADIPASACILHQLDKLQNSFIAAYPVCRHVAISFLGFEWV